MSALGDRHRTLRLAAGLSLRALAARIGTSYRTIDRIEKGGKQTRPELLAALDAFFGGQLLQGDLPPVIRLNRPSKATPPSGRHVWDKSKQTDGDNYQGCCTSRLQDGTICGAPCHRRSDGLPELCVSCWSWRTIPESARANFRRTEAIDKKARYDVRWHQANKARAKPEAAG